SMPPLGFSGYRGNLAINLIPVSSAERRTTCRDQIKQNINFKVMTHPRAGKPPKFDLTMNNFTRGVLTTGKTSYIPTGTMHVT
ncbi:MAG: hypothetical protein MJE68_04210, partial [Proteobacteria bacterium]|nr:hypothetical protein [Pseudomonadota bacterium]